MADTMEQPAVEIVHIAYNDNPKFQPIRNWFVSLDGENWLGVTGVDGEATAEDLQAVPVDEIRAIFAGNGKTVPMRMARRFLAHMMGGETTFLDR